MKARVQASAPIRLGSRTTASSLLGTCPDPNGNVQACAYMLNTCPGKVACGLALPAPGGGDGCSTIGAVSEPDGADAL